MSLASFKLSSRLRKSSASPKKVKYWDKESGDQAAPRGELDILDMEQLINIQDLESAQAAKS